MQPSAEQEKDIDLVAEWLRECRSVLFITGAGLSADSGLPTYRGVSGLYNAGNTEEGLPIEVMLSGETFAARPEWTWKYLRQVEQACRGARPNRGHEVIALAERHIDRVWTLTQNVDGLHRAAGSRNLIDIHGDLHDVRCTRCRYATHVDDFAGFEALPPRCPECGDVLRPDVVLFGEMLSSGKVQRLRAELHRGFDLVFTVGTSSVFPYITYPIEQAVQLGRPSVEINPDTTPVSELATVKLHLGAAAALDAIWRRVLC